MSQPFDQDRSEDQPTQWDQPGATEQPAQAGALPQPPAPGQPQQPTGWDQQTPAGSYSAPSPAVGQPSPAVGQPSPAASQPSPAAAPQAGQSAYGQTGWNQQSSAKPSGEGANFFRALFDFKFDHFITVKFSSFLYIVVFVVAALIWLGQIVSAIMFGAMLGSVNSFFGEPSFNAVPLVVSILFGWVPSVIALIAMRLGLELAVAMVRTAQNTTRIAESAETRA